jgi:hypothetical protein
MVIALDYDRTYTKCPELFSFFCDKAQELGHQVICVTSRNETEPIYNLNIPVFYTCREAKIFYTSKRGMIIDVWIDDDPLHIIQDL